LGYIQVVLINERSLACPRCNRRIPERAWSEVLARAACPICREHISAADWSKIGLVVEQQGKPSARHKH
jgi:RNA polymerase subunit RPABC4/transcription elongation factor Spt4